MYSERNIKTGCQSDILHNEWDYLKEGLNRKSQDLVDTIWVKNFMRGFYMDMGSINMPKRNLTEGLYFCPTT